MRQADLFSAAKPAELQPETPEPDAIRVRLRALLAEAQAASALRRAPQDAHVQEIVFHNMTDWLPEAERDEVRRAFAAEMARLQAAEVRAGLEISSEDAREI